MINQMSKRKKNKETGVSPTTGALLQQDLRISPPRASFPIVNISHLSHNGQNSGRVHGTSLTPSLNEIYPIIHIQSTLNNTLLTLTEGNGNTLYWTSAGSTGFKNSRKSTSYAAQAAAEKIAQFCQSRKIKQVNVKIKGLGYGKEACLKGLQLNGIIIHRIEEVNTIPHNGCRLPKKRRM